MSRKKKDTVESGSEVLNEQEFAEFAKSATPAVVPVKKGSFYTFGQWASMRGKKPHHIAGLKFFCKDIYMPRSLEDWDKAFDGY